MCFIFLQENVETDEDEDHKFLTLCNAEQADDEKRYTSDKWVDDCDKEVGTAFIPDETVAAVKRKSPPKRKPQAKPKPKSKPKPTPKPKQNGTARSATNQESTEQMKWNELVEPFENPNEKLQFTEFVGVDRLAATSVETPIDAFRLFFTDAILEQVTLESNRYHDQVKDNDDAWVPISVLYIKFF